MVSNDAMFAPGIGTSTLPPPDPTAAATHPKIAILSMGEMGLGIATLLSTYHYSIVTCLTNRSPATKARAAAVGITDVPFDEMLSQADIFLSIVPPSEALALSIKVADAIHKNREKPLIYLDLNAVSPTLSRKVSEPILAANQTYIDGCILGFPPKIVPRSSTESTSSNHPTGMTWFRPAIPISGPALPSSPSYAALSSLLNLQPISSDIGSASALKMCFSAINKSLAAVTLQSYSVASRLGILPALQEQMRLYFPGLKDVGEASAVASQRKAYRWIKEMEEVGGTFKEEGGWGTELWEGVRGVFEVVNGTEMSQETGRKTRVEEVSGEMCKALQLRRKSI